MKKIESRQYHHQIVHLWYQQAWTKVLRPGSNRHPWPRLHFQKDPHQKNPKKVNVLFDLFIWRLWSIPQCGKFRISLSLFFSQKLREINWGSCCFHEIYFNLEHFFFVFPHCHLICMISHTQCGNLYRRGHPNVQNPSNVILWDFAH